MDAKEATDKLNRIIHGEKIDFPRYLYKYRPFDEHVWDMLENNYLFLCPPKDLDDPSECIATIDFQDWYDMENNRLKKRCLDTAVEFIRPYTNETNIETIQTILSKAYTIDGYVKRNYLLECYFDLKELVPDKILVPAINCISNIPIQLEDEDVNNAIRDVFRAAVFARDEMGVCSLSEESDSQDMWSTYADNSSGYCIKFDITNYDYIKFLHPVIYSDTRETNIVNNFVLSFIGELISKSSQGNIIADRTPFTRMFLTKDTKWKYQNEWRLLGDAKQHMKAPKIETIYLGENVSADNCNKMREFCQNKNINLIEK